MCCVCVCVVCGRMHARERACVPSYSFKIVWILVFFFFVAYIMTVFITALYMVTLRCAMAEEDFTFVGFGSLLHCILWGLQTPHCFNCIWCYLMQICCVVCFWCVSFTYVTNFIVIIDLTRCCFLQYGALALFGWAGVAGTVTCAVDIVEGLCWVFSCGWLAYAMPIFDAPLFNIFPSCCNVFFIWSFVPTTFQHKLTPLLHSNTL